MTVVEVMVVVAVAAVATVAVAMSVAVAAVVTLAMIMVLVLILPPFRTFALCICIYLTYKCSTKSTGNTASTSTVIHLPGDITTDYHSLIQALFNLSDTPLPPTAFTVTPPLFKRYCITPHTLPNPFSYPCRSCVAVKLPPGVLVAADAVFLKGSHHSIQLDKSTKRKCLHVKSMSEW